MAKISDLVSRSGVDDAVSGVGAGAWYAEVAHPAPVSPGDDLYVTIPDLSFLGDATKFGPIRWGGKLVPNLGDGLLVIFDNRQQIWSLLGIADNTIPPSAPVSSVFGRIGAVVKQAGDYAVADVTGAESTAHASATYETSAHASATYATLAGLSTYAPLASPTLTGDPKAPTPAPGDSDTSIATTAFTAAAIAAAITGQALPKITASAISGGPPASPNNGDIWIATAVDANGTVWQFRYNSGSGSAYKWEFIGGAPITAGVLGSMTIAATGETNLTGGPTITTARSGDYILGVGCTVNAAAAQYLTVHPKGSVSGNIGPTITWSPPAAFYEVGWQETIVTGLAAQTFNITCAIANGTVGTGFQSGIIKITPIRIS